MYKRYRYIYFDLDRTLWDFEANSVAAFRDILERRSITGRFGSVEAFSERYKYHNEILWDLYRRGEMTKMKLRTERFVLTLADFNITDALLAEELGNEYIKLAPYKTHLIPNAKEIVEYLHDKYELFILTNGFNEVQFIKMKESGLVKYFRKIITSENARAQKPKKEIFTFAITSVNARKAESIMIGDDLEIDILGARNAGIDQVYYNPAGFIHDENITHEIKDLLELKSIL
ncbi:MAG: YjjG family noncanonical pyrimidine nucleotidase [Bacteroidales bacterium]